MLGPATEIGVGEIPIRRSTLSPELATSPSAWTVWRK